MLKSKVLIVVEDMASNFAKRLKELKSKKLVESLRFSHGKIKYKQHDDPRIKAIRSWRDLENVE